MSWVSDLYQESDATVCFSFLSAMLGAPFFLISTEAEERGRAPFHNKVDIPKHTVAIFPAACHLAASLSGFRYLCVAGASAQPPVMSVYGTHPYQVV